MLAETRDSNLHAPANVTYHIAKSGFTGKLEFRGL